MNNTAAFRASSCQRTVISRSPRTLPKPRSYSIKPPSSPTTPEILKPQAAENTRSRIHRIQSRLPRFLRSYTKPLINAPLTHVSAFLILHELTAVIPLFGLAGFFHYSQWMPPFVSEGKWVAEGVEKFGQYFRRKGWLGEVDEYGIVGSKRGWWWGKSEGGIRIIVE